MPYGTWYLIKRQQLSYTKYKNWSPEQTDVSGHAHNVAPLRSVSGTLSHQSLHNQRCHYYIIESQLYKYNDYYTYLVFGHSWRANWRRLSRIYLPHHLHPSPSPRHTGHYVATPPRPRPPPTACKSGERCRWEWSRGGCECVRWWRVWRECPAGGSGCWGGKWGGGWSLLSGRRLGCYGRADQRPLNPVCYQEGRWGR